MKTILIILTFLSILATISIPFIGACVATIINPIAEKLICVFVFSFLGAWGVILSVKLIYEIFKYK